MGRLRRTISAILAAVLTYGILSGFGSIAFAAVVPVNVYVDSFDSGTLVFHWDPLPGVQAVAITYHTPDNNNKGVPHTTIFTQTTNNASITGLKSDYIYDIDVQLFDITDIDQNNDGQVDAGIDPIGHGLLYYIPKITFYATAPAQAYEDIPGGGREIGRFPKLLIRWMMPRAWDSSGSNDYLLANGAAILTQMQTALRAVYNDNRTLSSLNFRVNISSDLTTLNSGSAQSSLLINQGAPNYSASVSGSNAVTAVVSNPDANDFMSFELWGRSDIAAPLPTRILPADNYALPDGDILPGTVYYMNIKPVYKNAGGNVNAVSVGNPQDQNGSLLSGTLPYANTPIRFQLTKDNANNIYVKIYKINQGSLDLPRLFYEVQASDDPSVPGDWAIKKRMDDTYFSGDSAVTVISGINPNNEIYYKVVVKSDSPDDRLESSKMPYTLSIDTSRPPVPANIIVDRRDLVIGTGADSGKKSTDVTISWDKPANWDTIMADPDAADDIVFHFLINTSQTETDIQPYPVLEAEGTSYGSYQNKFRLVKYVSARDVTVVGNRLQYKLGGFELFTGEYWNGTSDVLGKPVIITDVINNSDNPKYPDYLLPNKVYYLEMYTTNGAHRGSIVPADMSDRSIITSFTTLTTTQMDVPLPKSFRLDKNNVVTDPASPPSKMNNVELMFDKVTDIDWTNYTSNHSVTDDAIYYDLYMSSRTATNSFILIGSTETPNGDVVFTGADDSLSSSVRAKITKFTDPVVVPAFGQKLKPNTTYYFIVKTRLALKNEPLPKESIATAILPVTTVSVTVNPPDDSQRKPLAPTDFSIAVDQDGNPMVGSSSVTFTWQRLENDVVYELIRTTRKVAPDDLFSTYQNDPEYTSFLHEYDALSDSRTDGFVYLNPNPKVGDPPTHPGKFSYDSATRTCTYKVDIGLFPNKLYYFSLRAVRLDQANQPIASSVWTSLPVTTSLIEAPASLEVVSDAQLGFYWNDSSLNMTAEDYKIYVRAQGDTDYKLMTRSQSTVVKDGSTYYGRVMGLKMNTYYDIKVYKGINNSVLVYEKGNMLTRDGFHELEVQWKGLPVNSPYSGYEIAIRPEDASDYTVLTDADLQQYVDKNGQILSYYTEETPQTVTTDNLYFHARIKSCTVVLPGGVSTRQPLRSNVKYYIKVRAVRVDSSDTALISYSKYIGPVDTRTEFNQGDYDNTDREEKQKAVFMDKMKQLEEGYYWRVAVSSSSAGEILLKADRVVDAIRNSAGSTFVVDMTELTLNVDTDIINVPLSVINAVNSQKKSLVIKTAGAEFTLRPGTLDTENNQQIKSLEGIPAVRDLYFKLTVGRTNAGLSGLPTGYERVSGFNDLEVQAQGASKTDGELKKLFYNKLYDTDSGLVSQKLDMLLNAYIGNSPDSSKIMEEYINRLVEMIENELSFYIDNTMESAKLSNMVQNITAFDTPAAAKLTFTGGKQGIKLPYVLYDGSSVWQKVTSNTAASVNSLSFNVLKTGKYVVLLSQSTINDIPENHWAKEYITKLTSKYDLSDVFTGINGAFSPENKVSCKEIILLYEKVTGRTAADTGLDIKQKAEKLGLDSIINMNGVLKNVERQEAAAVLIKLFAAKKGVNAGSLRPGGTVYINDEAGIDDAYYNQVIMIIDLKVISLDSGGNFIPGGTMTRADTAAAFVKLLELTGDL